MGERKVVNKFTPWDFDPDKVSKVKLSNIGQFSVRMMLPFTVRCNSCGEFMYAGKKFNTRKENANGEDYLGIPIVRFYFKCVNCGGEFAIKTDPRTSDYVVESGATRNTNLFQNERQLELEEKKQLEETESLDAIKALENRAEESKREMDIYDALDTIHAQQKKTMNTDPEEAIRLVQERKEKKKKNEENQKKIEMDAADEEEMKRLMIEKVEKIDAEKDEVITSSFKAVKMNANNVTETDIKKNFVVVNGMKVTLRKKVKKEKKEKEMKNQSAGLVSY